MSDEPTLIEEHAGCAWEGRELAVVHRGGLLAAHTEIRVDGETVASTPRWSLGTKRASGRFDGEGEAARTLECRTLWWGPVQVRIDGETVYRGVTPGAVKQISVAALIGLVIGYALGQFLGRAVAGAIL